LKKHFSHNVIIIIITLIGAALRFYNFNNMSLMNDELSALMRTRFDTFHDLIYKGIATEGHPAGVQLFLFAWVHIFGDDVWVLRLPFVITGILCIPLTYLIASYWFGKNCGLFAAASVALLQYPILYSQLARMYSTGMFFVLLFAFAWTNLFFYRKTLGEKK
jgi:4-amino-4-deoxy-L-arabinose transferase-like glycosyltransferase